MPERLDYTMKVSIQYCARCGQDHDGLEFQLLTHPMNDSDGIRNYWAPCPTNGEPILMRILQVTKPPVRPGDHHEIKLMLLES